MKVIPCMYHKNGHNWLYAICHPMNAEATVKEMNERLSKDYEIKEWVKFTRSFFLYLAKVPGHFITVRG